MTSRLLPTLLAFFAVGALPGQEPAEGIPPSPGGAAPRYKLVAGPEQQFGTASVATLFRIDTWTGRVWVLRVIPSETESTGSLSIWVPLAEKGSPLHKAAEEKNRAAEAASHDHAPSHRAATPTPPAEKAH